MGAEPQLQWADTRFSEAQPIRLPAPPQRPILSTRLHRYPSGPGISGVSSSNHSSTARSYLIPKSRVAME
jgi:hypothetical protein